MASTTGENSVAAILRLDDISKSGTDGSYTVQERPPKPTRPRRSLVSSCFRWSISLSFILLKMFEAVSSSISYLSIFEDLEAIASCLFVNDS
jgi:hypothetical protein